MNPSFRTWRQRALQLAATLLPLWAVAQTPQTVKTTETTRATLPVEAFFKEPQFADATLSPDGQKVAFKLRVKDNRAKLVVMDLVTQTPTVVASFQHESVGLFAWVNNQRLVFNLAAWLKPAGQRDINAGLFAVDANGERYRQLAETIGSRVKNGDETKLLPQWTQLLRTSTRQTGDDIWVTVTEAYDKKFGADYNRVRKLNTVNGRWEDVDAPQHTTHWVFDAQDELRAATESRDGQLKMWLREPGQPWKTAATMDALARTLYPTHMDAQGQLYVISDQGQNTVGLYTWNFETNNPSDKPVLHSQSFDLYPRPVVRDGQVQGWRYTVDAPVTQWFHPPAQALQDAIDKALPHTVNVLSTGVSSASPHVLVHTFSDRTPGTTLVFNRDTQKFIRLGDTRPELRGQAMASMDFVHYSARDGLSIPSWLSLPAGSTKKNLPLLVYAHGGPWMRGQSWGWHADVQFLASRGYAVLQPEFRGSAGFGRIHFIAGWKQWGQAMQNDLADGAKWAIAQGIADPQRICIMGASYGGYAALMGLVNDPALFRCGINWVGVTDPQLLYSVNWSDTTDQAKTYGLPRLMGDSVKDADMLRTYSPLHQAARIKSPLLMAYGGKDERVPLVHGEKMRDALRAHNPQVEWVDYPDEGHGLVDLKAQSDFWQRVEKFLNKNLKQQP